MSFEAWFWKKKVFLEKIKIKTKRREYRNYCKRLSWEIPVYVECIVSEWRINWTWKSIVTLIIPILKIENFGLWSRLIQFKDCFFTHEDWYEYPVKYASNFNKLYLEKYEVLEDFTVRVGKRTKFRTI